MKEEMIELRVSSPAAWKDFIDGLWQDLDNELAVWEKQIIADITSPSFNSQDGEMILNPAERTLYDEKLRGNLESIQRMRELPHIIYASLQE